MPYVYRLDTENKIFYQLVNGHCTFSDLFKLSLEPELNPSIRPRVKFIIDNLLGDLETDQEGMKTFVEAMKELKKTGFELEPTAILANKKGIFFFVKSLELLVDDDIEKHKTFSSLDEAIVWLGETEKAQAIHRIRDELLQEVQDLNLE